MNEQRRQAASRLIELLRQENSLLDCQRYDQVRHLLSDKQAALQALERSAPAAADSDTADDAALAGTLARLADENRIALQRALRVQERIMGIVAGAARRMMETPVYGGQGTRTMRRTGLAVAMIKQA